MDANLKQFADLGIEGVASGAFGMYQDGLVHHFNHLVQLFAKDLRLAYKNQCDLTPQIDIMHQVIERDGTFFIKQFYDIMSKFIDGDLTDDMRDSFVHKHLREIPVFRALQLHLHWPNTPEETRQNIWKYIQQLWQCSVNYHEESADAMVDRAMEVVQTKQFHDLMSTMIDTMGGGGGGGDAPSKDGGAVQPTMASPDSKKIDAAQLQSFVTDLLGRLQKTSSTAITASPMARIANSGEQPKEGTGDIDVD